MSGVPKRLFRYAVAGFAVALALVFGGQFLGSVFAALGVAVTVPDGPTGIGLFVPLWAGLTVLWVRRMRDWEGNGSMWGPIPDEQYTGRFAEFGGIARHNWEKAVDQLPDGDDD